MHVPVSSMLQPILIEEGITDIVNCDCRDSSDREDEKVLSIPVIENVSEEDIIYLLFTIICFQKTDPTKLIPIQTKIGYYRKQK